MDPNDLRDCVEQEIKKLIEPARGNAARSSTRPSRNRSRPFSENGRARHDDEAVRPRRELRTATSNTLRGLVTAASRNASRPSTYAVHVPDEARWAAPAEAADRPATARMRKDDSTASAAHSSGRNAPTRRRGRRLVARGRRAASSAPREALGRARPRDDGIVPSLHWPMRGALCPSVALGCLEVRRQEEEGRRQSGCTCAPAHGAPSG